MGQPFLFACQEKVSVHLIQKKMRKEATNGWQEESNEGRTDGRGIRKEGKKEGRKKRGGGGGGSILKTEPS
jgi:hypothetical protein